MKRISPVEAETAGIFNGFGAFAGMTGDFRGDTGRIRAGRQALKGKIFFLFLLCRGQI